MPRTDDMFGYQKPRAAPLKRAHVVDAGNCMSTDSARFECSRCGWDSGWVPVKNVTEGKRGIPCPNCNAPHHRKD